MSARDDLLAEARATARDTVIRGLNPSWRAVLTDSESLDGVALVCTAEGADDKHTVLDLGSGPQRDEHGVYDCCPWPQFETYSSTLATYLVALLNADQEKDTATAATSTPLIVYRAGYERELIPLGWYTTPEAAREHCEDDCRTALAAEYPTGTTFTFSWLGDDGEEPDPWELAASAVVDGQPAEYEPTGYVVTPIEVATAYDPDADQ